MSTCRHDNGHGTRPAQQGHRLPGNVLQLKSLYGLRTRLDHGDLTLRHERDVDDLRRPHNSGHRHTVVQEQLGNPSWSAKRQDHDAEHLGLCTNDRDHQRDLRSTPAKPAQGIQPTVFDTSAALKNPILLVLITRQTLNSRLPSTRGTRQTLATEQEGNR